MTELLMSYSKIVYYGTAPQHSTSSGLDFSGILNEIFKGSDLLGKAGDAIKGFGEFLNGFSIIYSILSVIILCYFGYIAFRTILTIQGFIGGALVGALIGFGIGLSSSADEAASGAVIGALVVGFIGALLAHLLYKLGVFLFFAGGTFIVMLLLVGLGSGGDWKSAMTAGAIVGVIVGIIAVIVDKYFIIAGTATIGAFTGGSMLMYANTVLGVFAIIILLVTGILVQVLCTKKFPLKGKEPQPRRIAEQETPQRPSENYSNLRRCPHCGSLVSVFGTACDKCGFQLESLEPAPRASLQERLAKAAEDKDEGFSKLRRCPNCGSLVTAFGKTCDKCYAPLDEYEEDDEPVSTAPSFQAAQMNGMQNYGTAPYYGAAPVNGAPNFGTAPVNGAPNYSTAPVNCAPNYSTAPVNNAPNYSTAPVNSAPDYSTAPVNNAPNYSTAPVNSAPNYSTAPVNSAPNYSTAPVFTQQRCPGCNGILEPGERFCSSCGRPIA